MNLEDLKLYLPKYLSDEADQELFEGLKDFPDNIDERLYTDYLDKDEIIYQGDGLEDMLVINLPDTDVRPVKGMVLSNTCDIDPSNEKHFSSQIVYAPIFKLNKYKDSLISNSSKKEEQIEGHINAIKKQRITQIFYLPEWGDRIEESIVFLDRLNNISNRFFEPSKIPERRIFTLSDYGSYLFLLKLSIHFTRIQDEVERRSI